jgi:hypothetical protein
MLPTIDLDDQPDPVTCEVGDEAPDWYLSAKAGVGKSHA